MVHSRKGNVQRTQPETYLDPKAGMAHNFTRLIIRNIRKLAEYCPSEEATE